MNLKPGTVSPFGLLFDKELKVDFYIDSSDRIMMLLYIKGRSLIDIIKEHGNQVHVVKF